MSIDMNKYRITSSYYKKGGINTRIDMLTSQAKQEFEIYQHLAPNTHNVYINDSLTTIKATMIDVTDLETRSDTKSILTSRDNIIHCGDVVSWDSEKWLCIYNKKKNVEGCYKGKIQPVNAIIKMPFNSNVNNEPFILELPSVVTSGFSDIRSDNVQFKFDTSMIYVMLPYGDYTKTMRKGDRIWLYNDAWEISGLDWAEVNINTNRGVIRVTLKPSLISNDFDNQNLGVCDYYRYFSKTVNLAPTTPNSYITLSAISNSIAKGDSILINAVTNPIGQDVEFVFVGNNYSCTIISKSDNGCVIKSSNEAGIINVKCYLVSDQTKYCTYKFSVK